MNAVGIMVLLLAFYLFGRRLALPRLNSIAVFAHGWLVPVVVAAIPKAVGPPMLSDTWLMVWVATMGVASGCLAGTVGSLGLDRELPKSLVVGGTRILRWHFILTILLAGYGTLMVIRSLPIVASLGGWSAVLSSSAGEFRLAQIEGSVEAAQAQISGQGLVVSALNYGLFFGHAALFTGAVLWRMGRRVVALAPVGVCLLYGLASLQRSSFVMALLLFIICCLLLRTYELSPREDWRVTSRSLGTQLLVAAGASLAVLVPVQLRNVNSNNAVGLSSVTQYVMSGIEGLNARSTWNAGWLPPPLETSVGVGPSPGLGSYTFKNLFSVMGRLGLDVPVAPNFYDYYRTELFSERFFGNTGTAILDFRLDFGLVGMGVSFFVLSFACTIFVTLAYRGHVKYIVWAAFLLSTLYWSFFGSTLLNDFRYILVVVAGSSLVRRLLVSMPRTDVDLSVRLTGHS